MKVKIDCFAYKIKYSKKSDDLVAYCDALTTLECDQCQFYKKMNNLEKPKRIYKESTRKERKQTPDDYASRILSDIKYWEDRNKYN